MPDADSEPRSPDVSGDLLASQPIAEMTPEQRRRLLSRRTPPEAPGAFVEIGGSGTLARRVLRTAGWLMLLMSISTVFVLAFYRFTDSFRVALIVVAGMLLYMYAATRLAEGRLDKRE